MGTEIRKRLKCLCCGAVLTIPTDAETVDCRYCHEIMEVMRFTQEERRLAAAVEEMSRSVKEVEACMEKAIDEFARTGSATAGEIQRQAEEQYEALQGELERNGFLSAMMRATAEAEQMQATAEQTKAEMENTPARVVAMNPTESES